MVLGAGCGGARRAWLMEVDGGDAKDSRAEEKRAEIQLHRAQFYSAPR